MNRKRLWALFLIAALTLGLLAGCGKKEAPDQSAESDQSEEGTAAALGSLASFSARTVEGELFTQEDIAAKDVTVVNFWSLTCGPCIAEMPDLAEFSKALPDNVQVVTVCLDGSGNEERVEEVLEWADLGADTLIAGDGDLQSLCGNLMYTPTTVFVDSEGNLVGDAVIGGQSDLDEVFLEAVNRVLTAGGKDEISFEGQ